MARPAAHRRQPPPEAPARAVQARPVRAEPERPATEARDPSTETGCGVDEACVFDGGSACRAQGSESSAAAAPSAGREGGEGVADGVCAKRRQVASHVVLAAATVLDVDDGEE